MTEPLLGFPKLHASDDAMLALRRQWDHEYALLPTPHKQFHFHVVGLPPTAIRNDHAHPCDTMTYGLRGIIRILHGILKHRVQPGDESCRVFS